MIANAFLDLTEEFDGWRTITNVSSGVAERAKASWSSYSAAKAGLRIYSQALAQEMSEYPKTRVLSFNPGIMDTEMQKVIREQSEDVFAEVGKFRGYKEEGKLVPPAEVARKLLSLLENPEQIQKVEYSVAELR